MASKAAITVLGSPGEVEARWRGSEFDRHETVTFGAAPGDRGTEIHVDAAAEEIAMGKAKDDLRRFKQLFETGEIARSDASPEGELVERKLNERPAQPLAAGELEKAGVS